MTATEKEKKDEHNEDERIEVLLFDLDGTLYDNACGYADAITTSMRFCTTPVSIPRNYTHNCRNYGKSNENDNEKLVEGPRESRCAQYYY